MEPPATTKPPQPQQKTAKKLPPLTEEELKKKEFIAPEDVLRLTTYTKDYLYNGNAYDIEFVKYKIRDMDSGTVLLELGKPENEESEEDGEEDVEDDEEQSDEKRKNPRYVRYIFKSYFLKLKNIGASVEFTVGDQPINKFRMIERHFFKDRLLKSFDFDFGFCIPNSHNTCEHIYNIPELPEDLIQEMIDAPFETRSDSFYFVDNRLVLHNKADYAYQP
uniref:GMP phosphodiesterase delta subunit domain-containing protein n=1 Tax=Panagrolaimus sp. PS1159 TaxID=55785 RepID=A0AC35FS35_9BILA